MSRLLSIPYIASRDQQVRDGYGPDELIEILYCKLSAFESLLLRFEISEILVDLSVVPILSSVKSDPNSPTDSLADRCAIASASSLENCSCALVLIEKGSSNSTAIRLLSNAPLHTLYAEVEELSGRVGLVRI